jgi:hypothetical protein
MVHVHSQLLQASSLHPKIKTTVELKNEDIAAPNCHLDVVYVLPASVFVDPYQLQDLEPLLGKATVIGEHDLELPLEKIKETRGSIVFLRQQQPLPSFQLELPIHLRYQHPLLEKDSQTIVIEPPFAGWTCGSNKPPLSSEYPLLLDAIGQDPIDTAFTKLSYDPKPLQLSVPVGKVEDAPLVTYGTFFAVVFCTLWITRSVFLSIKKRRRSEVKGKRRKSE